MCEDALSRRWWGSQRFTLQLQRKISYFPTLLEEILILEKDLQLLRNTFEISCPNVIIEVGINIHNKIFKWEFPLTFISEEYIK